MPERLIAHRMSQFIVDPLEIIHINHQKSPLVLRAQFDLPLQMCVKLPAVIQSGQPVCRDLPVLRIQINKQYCQCHKGPPVRQLSAKLCTIPPTRLNTPASSR